MKWETVILGHGETAILLDLEMNRNRLWQMRRLEICNATESVRCDLEGRAGE